MVMSLPCGGNFVFIEKEGRGEGGGKRERKRYLEPNQRFFFKKKKNETAAPKLTDSAVHV